MYIIINKIHNLVNIQLHLSFKIRIYMLSRYLFILKMLKKSI